MHDEGPATGGGYHRDEAGEERQLLAVVDADAAFDRDRHGGWDGGDHGGDAGGDMLRLGHEAGAEAPTLNALRRAAAVEVDLVIAEVGADRGGAGELGRLAAAQLQRHRMLALVEGEVASSRSPWRIAPLCTISV